MESSSESSTTEVSPLVGDRLVGLRRPLIEWLLWVLVLGVMLVFVAGPLLIRATRSDTSGVSVIILAIFAVVLVKNFFDILFIDREMKLAGEQLALLRETNNIVYFLRSSKPSLLRNHIQNLYQIFKRDVTISQDNLVSLMQSRLHARTRLADFCSSILVTLGLVGTIIGLIASAGGLERVVQSVGADNTAVLGGMEQTIGGMGIAFYTTLMGALLGGVFLRLLSNIVEGNVDRLVSHIAELTEVYILPIMRSAARIIERQQEGSAENSSGDAPVPVNLDTDTVRAAMNHAEEANDADASSGTGHGTDAGQVKSHHPKAG